MHGFILIEDGYTKNMATNRAFELRRESKRNADKYGQSKRHLYRVAKTSNGYGIYWQSRNVLSC
jgi:hypothetical protein